MSLLFSIKHYFLGIFLPGFLLLFSLKSNDSFRINNERNCSFSNDTCPTGKETNIWYLGNGGLDWSNGKPDTISGFNGAFYYEGNSSICDRNGNLILYTNNWFIYNKHHQLITQLKSNSSSTMTLILPQPGNDSIYYFFNPDDNLGTQDPSVVRYLRYTIINIRGNNGDGLVIRKDVPLLAGSSEKVCGVRHCNQNDWWIVGLRSVDESFYSWRLTDTGLVIVPEYVSSSGKTNHNLTYPFQNAGYLKPSHDGSILAEVTTGYSVELHHFDPSNGRVFGGFTAAFKGSELFYGAEFSPDNTKLYITSVYGIFQLDLSISDSVAIKKSLTTLFNGNAAIGAPVLGHDGKIYITAGSLPFLHVIKEPNEIGINCQLKIYDFKMSYGSSYGAPQFASGLQFPYTLNIQGPNNFCADTTVQFHLMDPCPHPDTEWSLPDGGDIKMLNRDTINVYFQTTGNKRLIAAFRTPCGYKSDTLNIEVKPCEVTSVNISSTDLNINLYPNPAYNSVTFIFNKINFTDARLYLVDIINKVTIDKSIRIEDGMYHDSFDDLKPGVYFYSFLIRNKISNFGKFIKI